MKESHIMPGSSRSSCSSVLIKKRMTYLLKKKCFIQFSTSLCSSVGRMFSFTSFFQSSTKGCVSGSAFKNIVIMKGNSSFSCSRITSVLRIYLWIVCSCAASTFSLVQFSLSKNISYFTCSFISIYSSSS